MLGRMAAKVPWWFGVTLAVIAYAVLHQFLLSLAFLAAAAASAAWRVERGEEALTMPRRIEPYLGKPPCPRCSRPMLQQVAKQGSSAGKSFWGCPGFPECRGTLPID